VTREILLVAHTGRVSAVEAARGVVATLVRSGIPVRVLADEAPALGLEGVRVVDPAPSAADGVELALVLGGDGTLLRAAEIARPCGAPLLGVNWGHVGFLAETEPDVLGETVRHIVDRSYTVEERMTVEMTVSCDGQQCAEGWALNEVTVEKAARERMLEVVVEIDGHPLSRWGCDGVVCATPTGSTAYAFSAGGPVVWPQVEAMLLVPISAHALFSRPLVVAPTSVLAIEVLPSLGGGTLFCDGRRMLDLPPSARIEVRRGGQPVRLARTHVTPFTDRLVAKFALPVQGWRGRRG
jgi:NAD+ kinase